MRWTWRCWSGSVRSLLALSTSASSAALGHLRRPLWLFQQPSLRLCFLFWPRAGIVSGWQLGALTALAGLAAATIVALLTSATSSSESISSGFSGIFSLCGSGSTTLPPLILNSPEPPVLRRHCRALSQHLVQGWMLIDLWHWRTRVLRLTKGCRFGDNWARPSLENRCNKGSPFQNRLL